jgi:hypothetical protein
MDVFRGRKFGPLTLSLVLVTAFILSSFLPTHTANAAEGCLAAVDAPGCMYGLPADQYQALLAQMQANPAPTVGRVAVDQAELRRWSLWQLDRKNVTYYDSPGGNAIGTENPGYAFISPKNRTEGWAEVEPGKWVSTSNLSGTRASGFTGVLLGGPLPFPMAWILRGTRGSELPGRAAKKSAPLLGQYKLVYIYATVQVDQWEWYLVGPGQWVNQRGVGRVVPTQAHSGGRWIAVDLYEQVLTAYEGGTPVFATLVSSGLPQWATAEGSFAVWSKMKADPMSGSMGKPDQYSIAYVPYVMYFNGSMALHGTFWHNSFGFKHSHGCVNLSIGDAKWLFDWLDVGTPVVVYRSR